jgi:hypothetical protein
MGDKTKKSTSNKNRKTQKRGGKFVFAGAAGCTFRPALKCKSEEKRREGKISKLMDKYAAEEELELTKLIKEIDGEQKYFIYPDEMCQPDLSESPEDDYTSCKLIDVKNKYISPRILISEDGGTDLWNVEVPKEDYLGFFEGLTNLFKGLAELHANSIVHLDIKPANMVGKRLLDGSYKIRYIDFGLSSNVIVASKSQYHENYAYWPYDIKLLTKRFKFSQEGLVDFYNTQKTGGRYFPKWLAYNEDGTFLIYEQYANKINAMILSGEINAIELIKGADIYGLGRSMTEIYGRILKHRWVEPGTVRIENGEGRMKIHEQIKSDISEPFYKLAERMIHISPLERPSAAEALQIYEGLLPAMRLHFPKFKKAVESE